MSYTNTKISLTGNILTRLNQQVSDCMAYRKFAKNDVSLAIKMNYRLRTISSKNGNNQITT